MAEAAERRIQQQENRGIKDPGKVKRLQQRRDELDKELAAAGPQSEPNLRVSTPTEAELAFSDQVLRL